MRPPLLADAEGATPRCTSSGCSGRCSGPVSALSSSSLARRPSPGEPGPTRRRTRLQRGSWLAGCTESSAAPVPAPQDGGGQTTTGSRHGRSGLPLPAGALSLPLPRQAPACRRCRGAGPSASTWWTRAWTAAATRPPCRFVAGTFAPRGRSRQAGRVGGPPAAGCGHVPQEPGDASAAGSLPRQPADMPRRHACRGRLRARMHATCGHAVYACAREGDLPTRQRHRNMPVGGEGGGGGRHGFGNSGSSCAQAPDHPGCRPRSRRRGADPAGADSRRRRRQLRAAVRHRGSRGDLIPPRRGVRERRVGAAWAEDEAARSDRHVDGAVAPGAATVLGLHRPPAARVLTGPGGSDGEVERAGRSPVAGTHRHVASVPCHLAVARPLEVPRLELHRDSAGGSPRYGLT
jgi:hypothetical protein